MITAAVLLSRVRTVREIAMRPISLEQAWAIIADAAVALGSEDVALADAAGRVAIAPVVATFDSPRTDVSMMDGYAVGNARIGESYDVIGTSAAGARFDGKVAGGQAVRIFTGAAVPDGADSVVIQENVARDGDRMTFVEATAGPSFIRAKGSDFRTGDQVVAGERGLPLARWSRPPGQEPIEWKSRGDPGS